MLAFCVLPTAGFSILHLLVECTEHFVQAIVTRYKLNVSLLFFFPHTDFVCDEMEHLFFT